ncbi:MAG: hypothetical protein A2932_01280 [Candidatus Spechtbacteria bacterium RIFCSPLOWO2_01_FULL_46_10]|uniref:TspO protein n=1 Tax=Candidatus Spechtbacteria bacterium RIFCSPLOWO2_01_FULL_46_10 TaxID=1802163 RepID=A0A1G2HGN3_9BACT|nr:MAG: hypothetical protein A2932_01280 [Candidatus Spechtbacteria bacterium RIFCSPLOWO2_01_FULL_46_10]
MKKFLSLSGFVLASLAAGAVGSIFIAGNIGTWYAGLMKPVLTPPGWVFVPAWITLYTLMGTAAFLVWRARQERPAFAKVSAGRGECVNCALVFFFTHLIFNVLWSIFFFGFHLAFIALIDIFILWAMIAALIFMFWRINRTAALLLVPYLLWVSFAVYLNFAIFLLN